MRKQINRDVLIVLVLLTSLTFAIGAVVVWRLKILHQPLIILAGSKNDPYYKLSERYQKFLAGKRINVAVCATAGSPQILDMLAGQMPSKLGDIKCTALENKKHQGGQYKITEKTLQQLLDNKYKIVAGFTQGGVQTIRAEEDRRKAARRYGWLRVNGAKSTSRALYSMGRVLAEPLWVFYTCNGKNDLSSLGELQGRNLYAGASRSGTNLLARFLLGEFGIKDNIQDSSADIAKDKNAASFKAVAARLRDADRKLSPTRDVCLLNIADADGLAQRYPFLKRAVLHKGALNPSKKIPETDVNLVVTQAAFVVRKELDVALQNLFAQAVLHVQTDLGDEATFFPVPSSALTADDPEFPASPEALRVYRSDKTFFQRVLPFWIATILDDIIVFLLAMPFLGIMLQFFRMVPITRDMLIRMRRDRVHRELHALDGRIEKAVSEDDLRQIEGERERIMKRAQKITLPEAERFALTRHNRHVKEHLLEMRAKMQTY
jgi:hypothetical protein